MREGLPLFDKTDNFSWVPDVTSSPALTTPPGGDELVDGSTTNAGGPNSSSSAGVGIRPTRPGDDDIRADALVPSVGYSSRPASSSYGAGGGANSQGGDSATFAPYYGPAPGTARGRGSVHEGVPARSPRVHSSLSRPQRERNRRVSSVSPRPVPPRASSVASNDPRGQKSPAAPVVADATGPASDSKAARAALIYSSYRPTSSYWPPQPSARGGTSGTGLPAPAPTGKQPSRAGTPSRREENAGPIPGEEGYPLPAM